MGRLQPERVRRGGRWHGLDRNKRWTLSFQAASAPRARITARGRFHQDRHWTDGCFRATNPSFDIHSSSLIARFSAPECFPVKTGLFFATGWEARIQPGRRPTQRELQFAALAPGAYRLQIEARDSDGVWSGHGAEFPFKILTPWYWTWWFLGMCGLIPLSVGLGVLRLRMLGAQRRERELQRLVEKKTADLRRVNEDLLRLSSSIR